MARAAFIIEVTGRNKDKGFTIAVMKFWAGVTDNQWFEFLSARRFPDVNFWQPSARAPFTNLPAGTPFLFKLKHPHNHIAGGGFFVKFMTLPLLTAWEYFGEENGAPSLAALSALIRPLARNTPQGEIGCTILTSVFYLPRHAWIAVPSKWAPNIVVGKTFDTELATDAALWNQVVDAAAISAPDSNALHTLREDAPRYGQPFLARARLGQSVFRALVTDAYQKRCAITGENILPVLEAAHIRPFSDDGPNSTSNGLLLRSDFHKLFDLGYVTITPELRIEVSPRIREEWYNGKAYFRLHGHELAVLPGSPADRPAAQYLRWHNERFLT